MATWFSKTESEPCLNPVYATRRLSCPHCGEMIEAAMRAVTLRCRSCHKQLQFQDAVYSKPATENVSTLGQVRINRKGSLRGRIDCGSLLVQGLLDGNVQVRGEARIDAKASVSGTLTARRIVVEPGGSFRGTLCIGEADSHSRAGGNAALTPGPSVSSDSQRPS